MRYKKINNKDIVFFINALTKESVIVSEEDIKPYSHDETEDLAFSPEIALNLIILIKYH